LFETGRVQFVSATDDEAMNAGIELAQNMEGIIPAIESAHAIAAVSKLELTPEDVVVINLSGRGDKDLET
jgi:tryptophan synthase beta chain